MVLSPGTNFAKSKVLEPYRTNTSSVRRTHESGSIEIRHSRFKTPRPRRRPISYQMESLNSAATAATASAMPKENFPRPASAPIAISTGAAGKGRPNCSASTIANNRAYPWRIRNSNVAAI